MNVRYTTMAGLFFDETEVSAVHAGSPNKPVKITDSYVSTILEIFAVYDSIEEAYAVYKAVREKRAAESHAVADALRGAMRSRLYPATMLLFRGKLFICPPELVSEANKFMLESLYDAYQVAEANSIRPSQKEVTGGTSILDLTALSRATLLVASTIQNHLFPVEQSYPDLSLEDFTSVVERLYTDGFLTAPTGAIDFGSFKRHASFCPDFGYSRGTPIDRYYLERFIAVIRNDVAGHTLEIGGKRRNQRLYGFTNVTSYLTMDIIKHPEVDIVGDANDKNAVERQSLDSIILFNVLEHCETPQLVIQNVYGWLKNGGRAFCMVPNAQRVHAAPRDYWRPLPDAIESLFASFPIRKLFLYGNPITTVASLMGIAAEELSEEDLDYLNSAYPVATCVVAQKLIT